MFSVFGEALLDPINTNASSTEITEWKNSRKTAEAYQNLFEDMRNEEVTFMTRILEKVWPKTEVSEELSAFAISICQIMLNPKNETIQINEMNMKRRIIRNKV
jgi:hypothetical protein